jgi:hypothetical protein
MVRHPWLVRKTLENQPPRLRKYIPGFSGVVSGRDPEPPECRNLLSDIIISLISLAGEWR